MAAEIGDQIGAGGDVAAHGHLRHIEQCCCVAQMQRTAIGQDARQRFQPCARRGVAPVPCPLAAAGFAEVRVVNGAAMTEELSGFRAECHPQMGLAGRND